MLLVGALVTLPGDGDLFLLKSVPVGSERVRIQRWSDGTIRSAFQAELRVLTPELAIEKLWNKIADANRSYEIRSNRQINFKLSLMDEVRYFVVGSHQNYDQNKYKHDFILELIILVSWQQTYQECFITHLHIYKKVCAYCGMADLNLPTFTLVKRRVRKLSSMRRINDLE